jgi:hypothetical protein
MNKYGYIYNILNDCTTGIEMLQIKTVLGKMQTPHVNIITLNQVFPLGLTTDPKFASDQDDYTICNWLGFFQGSTSIIDTSMFGQIDLEISFSTFWRFNVR